MASRLLSVRRCWRSETGDDLTRGLGDRLIRLYDDVRREAGGIRGGRRDGLKGGALFFIDSHVGVRGIRSLLTRANPLPYHGVGTPAFDHPELRLPLSRQ